MSQNLGLPKLHRSGGSRIFFATFFIDSKLPSRATEIEMSQKIISKNLAYQKKLHQKKILGRSNTFFFWILKKDVQTLPLQLEFTPSQDQYIDPYNNMSLKII